MLENLCQLFEMYIEIIKVQNKDKLNYLNLI
jgi:hypothetical protein